jgi:hypothetical protein
MKRTWKAVLVLAVVVIAAWPLLRVPRSLAAPRITKARVDPATRHLLVYVVPANSPQGNGAWSTAAGLDNGVAVALKVAADGTLVMGADPGGAIQGCQACIVIGGMNGLTSVALKVGADGTVATSGGTVNGIFPSQIDACATAKCDAHQITFTTNSSTSQTITAGACTASDVGKKVYGIQIAGANALSYTTVTGCSGTTLTTTGTAPGNFAGAIGYIGTDDTAALNALTLALKVGQTLYLGSKTIMVSNQIFSNGQMAITGAPTFVRGDRNAVGENTLVQCTATIVYPPFDTPWTTFFIVTNASLSDICFDPGTKANVTAGGPFVFAFLNGYMNERLSINNWYAGVGSGACFYFSSDGIQASYLSTFGCGLGMKVAASGMTIIQPTIKDSQAAGDIGLYNFDTGTLVVGGVVADAVADNQVTNGTMTFSGTLIGSTNPSNPAIKVLNGANVYLSGNTLIGGLKDCSLAANTDGVNIAAGGYVTASQTRFCKGSGTGFAVRNAGTYVNVGGNLGLGSGTTTYSGAGTYLSVLTHAANTCYVTIAPIVNSTTYTMCNQFVDQATQLFRIKAASQVVTACTVAPVITITDGTLTQTLTLTTAKQSWDSSVDASTNVPGTFASGGTLTMTIASGTCTTPATNLSVTYSYQNLQL